MPQPRAMTLRHNGDFSLSESVGNATRSAFVEDLRDGGNGAPAVLDLAFPLEGSWNPVGVRVWEEDGTVHARVLASLDGAEPGEVRAALEGMLSLDVNADAYTRVAGRDGVAAALQREHPGLRPVLFSSPYEAAARAIIGQRIAVRQAAAVHARIAERDGIELRVGDRTMHAFPAPQRLAEMAPVQGLAERKVTQLRALGTAAAAGWLDRGRLRAMDREAAMAHLQELAGIGPFSAELILLRGAGDPDAFPRAELSLHRAMATAYRLGGEPGLDVLERIAEQWRPYRSWIGLLLRNTQRKRSG